MLGTLLVREAPEESFEDDDVLYYAAILCDTRIHTRTRVSDLGDADTRVRYYYSISVVFFRYGLPTWHPYGFTVTVKPCVCAANSGAYMDWIVEMPFENVP